MADGEAAATLHDFLVTRGYAAVDLACNAVGHFEVAEARLNGEPVRLLLDTGASHTVFDRASAARLGLSTSASGRQGGGVGGAEQAVEGGTAAELTVGPVALRDLPVVALDLSHVSRALEAHGGSPIDGALGGDVLRPAEAVIDYARAMLYLRTGRTAAAHASRAHLDE